MFRKVLRLTSATVRATLGMLIPMTAGVACAGRRASPAMARPASVSVRTTEERYRPQVRGGYSDLQIRLVVENGSPRLLHPRGCDGSPEFELQREVPRAGEGPGWRTVFVPICTGGSPPRVLRPGESAAVAVVVSQYPDEPSGFRFPSTPTRHRIVFALLDAPPHPDPRTRARPGALLPMDERASNAFVIVPP